MTQEAKFRVRVDTAQAKKDLQDLARLAGGIEVGGNAIGRDESGGSRFNLAQALGLGAAIGTGAAMIGSVSRSSFGDVAGEFFAPIGATLSNAIFGQKDDEARARSSAREQTIAAFGSHATNNREAALNYFNQVSAINLNREKGASAIREDPRFYTSGSKPGEQMDIWKFIGDKLYSAITEGFKRIVDFLGGLV